MLPSKKKLIPRSKLTNVIPPKKKLPPAPIDDDDEDQEDVVDEDEVVDEEVEAPRPKKKLVPRKQVVEEDEEDTEEAEDEEEQPKRKVSKKVKSALAKAFDSVPLSGSADEIPAGKYEAIIREAVVQPFSEEKGQSIRFKYEFATEGIAGSQMTQWFKIIDSEGQPVDWMIDMLKKALAKLGIEIEGDELEETVQEIHETHPGIVLKVAYAKGSDGNVYPRLTIQGPCDNEVIEEYKDSVPY